MATACGMLHIMVPSAPGWWMEEAKWQTRAKCVRVFSRRFQECRTGFFPFCLLLLPPAQTVVQLSMLDSVSGRQRASEFKFFFSTCCKVCARPRAWAERKVVAVNGASIAPAHKTVISAGRIVIFCEEEEGGTCERREELQWWPGLRNQLWIQMAVYTCCSHEARCFRRSLVSSPQISRCTANSSSMGRVSCIFQPPPQRFCFSSSCPDLHRQIQRVQRGVAACFLAEKLFHRPPCHRRLGRKLAHLSGVAATPSSSASPLWSGDNARRTKGVVRLPQPVP